MLDSLCNRPFEMIFSNHMQVRIADRTALILDIFDQRARSSEGRLQVALAAATYELPRLKRMWTHLERQMGGGAMRAGMGESQKEIDKRLLRCALYDQVLRAILQTAKQDVRAACLRSCRLLVHIACSFGLQQQRATHCAGTRSQT